MDGWYAIVVVVFLVAMAVVGIAPSFAPDAPMKVCINAKMEWIDGDCINPKTTVDKSTTNW